MVFRCAKRRSRRVCAKSMGVLSVLLPASFLPSVCFAIDAGVEAAEAVIGTTSVSVSESSVGETICFSVSDEELQLVMESRPNDSIVSPPLSTNNIVRIIRDRSETPVEDSEISEWLDNLFFVARNIQFDPRRPGQRTNVERIVWNMPVEILDELVRALILQLTASGRGTVAAIDLIDAISRCGEELERRQLRQRTDCAIELALARWLNDPAVLEKTLNKQGLIDLACLTESCDELELLPRYSGALMQVVQNPRFGSAETLRGALKLALRLLPLLPYGDPYPAAFISALNLEVGAAIAHGRGLPIGERPAPRMSLGELLEYVRGAVTVGSPDAKGALVKAYVSGGLVTTVRELMREGNGVLRQAALATIEVILPYCTEQRIKELIAEDLLILMERVASRLPPETDTAVGEVFAVITRAVGRDGALKEIFLEQAQRLIDANSADPAKRDAFIDLKRRIGELSSPGLPSRFGTSRPTETARPEMGISLSQ